MTEAQKQALQRFLAVLIVQVVGLATAALSAPEFMDAIAAWTGEGSWITLLIASVLPPFLAALAKLAAGPTQKAPLNEGDAARGRARTRTGEAPGLFG